MQETGNAGKAPVKFKTVITAIGKEKIARAALNGEKVNIETAVIADGGGSPFVPEESMTALPGEVWRGPIKRKRIDAVNPNMINVTVFLDGTVGGWTARGIGLLDSEGDLIAAGNMPDTVKALIVDGVAATMTVCMKIAVSNADALEFRIDPSGLTINEEQLYEALEIEQRVILSKVEEIAEQQSEAIAGKADATKVEQALEALSDVDESLQTQLDALSQETQQALAEKAAAVHTHTKSEVGLGNVDNTADSEKSVKYAASAGSAVDQTARNSAASAQTTANSASTAAANANANANNRMPYSGGTFTGHVAAPGSNTATWRLRNAIVTDSGWSPVSSNSIWFIRK